MPSRVREKIDYPVERVRRFLEPGPVVLVSSAFAGQLNIMTLGWHTIMEFSPSTLGCMISSGNHSFEMIRRSGECVINVPASHLIDTVVDIGNCSGHTIDKFQRFGLTPATACSVSAPLIEECFANLECRLADASLVDRYNFFIFEVLKAHVAPTPRFAQTLHYLGDGQFMLSGKVVSRRGRFRPSMLDS